MVAVKDKDPGARESLTPRASEVVDVKAHEREEATNSHKGGQP